MNHLTIETVGNSQELKHKEIKTGSSFLLNFMMKTLTKCAQDW